MPRSYHPRGVGPQRKRSDWNAEGVPEPTEGEVLFGCRAYTPAQDRTFGSQQNDPRKPQHGLWRVGRSRRHRKCRCGGSAVLRGLGPAHVHEGCSAYAQEHRLPTVIQVASYEGPKKAKEEAARKAVTRRERRALKFGKVA